MQSIAKTKPHGTLLGEAGMQTYSEHFALVVTGILAGSAFPERLRVKLQDSAFAIAYYVLFHFKILKNEYIICLFQKITK